MTSAINFVSRNGRGFLVSVFVARMFELPNFEEKACFLGQTELIPDLRVSNWAIQYLDRIGHLIPAPWWQAACIEPDPSVLVGYD